MLSRIKKNIRKFDHILLLVGLILLIATPIWEKLVGNADFKTSISGTLTIILIVILMAGTSLVYSHRVKGSSRVKYMGLITTLFTLLNAYNFFGSVFNQITHYMQVIFFLLLTTSVFSIIMRSRKVDAEVVINSISGYLLTGLSWSILIEIWEVTYPSSFNFGLEGEEMFFDVIYYCFVTMTTLGYGDMVPQTHAAKSFSILIAVTGAFYNTIALGMIVGKYIWYQSNIKMEDKE